MEVRVQGGYASESTLNSIDTQLSDGIKVTADSSFPQITVDNAVQVTAHDLNANYSGTSNITNDYILDHIQFNFSTNDSKTITITAADGTVIWSEAGNTSQDIILEDIEKAFNANDNFTISVTSGSSGCLMDVLATVKTGSATLGGDPSVTIQSPSGDTVTTTDYGDKTGLDVNLLGKTVTLPDDQEAIVTQADTWQHIETISMFKELLFEMRKMNKHLKSITGEEFLDTEIQEK